MTTESQSTYEYRYRNVPSIGPVPSAFCPDTTAATPQWREISIDQIDLEPGYYQRDQQAMAKGYPPHWRPCALCHRYIDQTDPAQGQLCRRGRSLCNNHGQELHP